MPTPQNSDHAATQTLHSEKESAVATNAGRAYLLIIEERAARRFDLPESGQLVIGRENVGAETILIQLTHRFRASMPGLRCLQRESSLKI